MMPTKTYKCRQTTPADVMHLYSFLTPHKEHLPDYEVGVFIWYVIYKFIGMKSINDMKDFIAKNIKTI